MLKPFSLCITWEKEFNALRKVAAENDIPLSITFKAMVRKKLHQGEDRLEKIWAATMNAIETGEDLSEWMECEDEQEDLSEWVEWLEWDDEQ